MVDLKKAMKDIEHRSEAAKPKPVYSSDPKKAKLERRMDKIGDRIKRDKESYK